MLHRVYGIPATRRTLQDWTPWIPHRAYFLTPNIVHRAWYFGRPRITFLPPRLPDIVLRSSALGAKKSGVEGDSGVSFRAGVRQLYDMCRVCVGQFQGSGRAVAG